MLAHALALTQRKSVCLTHADFGNGTLFNILGIEPVTDLTRSLSHVAKMLRHNMLHPEDVPDYAIRLFNGLDFYSTDRVILDNQEMLAFYDFLLNRMVVYNHIVIDVDSGLKSPVSKLALRISDMVIIPVTHNNLVVSSALKFRDEVMQSAAQVRRRRELRVFFLLNHYDPTISTYSRVAKALRVRPSQLLLLRDNHALIKASNEGKISDAFADAVGGGKNFANLTADMKLCCKLLLGREFVWDQKRRER
jgi:cellulose biosynthesis protein BcsQ